MERTTRFVWGNVMDVVERGIRDAPLLGTPLKDGPSDARPVILMAGYGNSPTAMSAIGRSLERDGFRHVYYLPTPEHGMANAQRGVALLDELIARVRAETGSTQVDLLAHSRNGQVARAYVQQTGGEGVHGLVTLTSANHGVQWGPFRWLMPEGMQAIAADSPMMRSLNDGDMTPPGVAYTAISTGGFDWVMNPASSGRLPTDSNVANVVVDEGRRLGPISKVSHYGVLTDDTAYEAMRAALLAD